MTKFIIDFSQIPHEDHRLISKIRKDAAIFFANIANALCPDMYPYMVDLRAGELAAEMKLDELILGISAGELEAEFIREGDLADFINNHPSNQKGTIQ